MRNGKDVTSAEILRCCETKSDSCFALELELRAVRIGELHSSLVPLTTALLAWLGIYLRDERVRACSSVTSISPESTEVSGTHGTMFFMWKGALVTTPEIIADQR